MQRVIATPILELAEKMKLVTHRQDYQVRAVKTGDDEVGSLIDGFNNMLTQINSHDRELSRNSENAPIDL